MNHTKIHYGTRLVYHWTKHPTHFASSLDYPVNLLRYAKRCRQGYSHCWKREDGDWQEERLYVWKPIFQLKGSMIESQFSSWLGARGIPIIRNSRFSLLRSLCLVMNMKAIRAHYRGEEKGNVEHAWRTQSRREQKMSRSRNTESRQCG